MKIGGESERYLQLGAGHGGDNVIIQQSSQEFIILLTGDVSGESLLGSFKLGGSILGTQLLLNLVGLFIQKLKHVLGSNLLAFSSFSTMASPLPELGTRDFSSSSILHHVVQGDTANTTEPGFHIAQTNLQVVTDTSFSGLTREVRKQVITVDTDIITTNMDLVRLGHLFIEDSMAILTRSG